MIKMDDRELYQHLFEIKEKLYNIQSDLDELFDEDENSDNEEERKPSVTAKED